MKDLGLKVEILLQGVGVLISWNAILTGLDWFNTKFPDYNTNAVLPFLNFTPYIIFQPLTILYGNKFGFNIRIVLPYVVMAAVLAMIPFFVILLSELGAFVVMGIGIFISGCVNAISQTSVFGLAGTMPGVYTNLVMVGNGLAGLGINVIRLICLGIFPDSSTGLLESTAVYFIISGTILIVCCFAQLRLMRHPLVKSCIAGTTSVEAEKDNSVIKYEELSSVSEERPSTDQTQPRFKDVVGSIWEYLFQVWLCYFITFGMLAHVAIATQVE